MATKNTIKVVEFYASDIEDLSRQLLNAFFDHPYEKVIAITGLFVLASEGVEKDSLQRIAGLRDKISTERLTATFEV